MPCWNGLALASPSGCSVDERHVQFCFPFLALPSSSVLQWRVSTCSRALPQQHDTQGIDTRGTLNGSHNMKGQQSQKAKLRHVLQTAPRHSAAVVFAAVARWRLSVPLFPPLLPCFPCSSDTSKTPHPGRFLPLRSPPTDREKERERDSSPSSMHSTIHHPSTRPPTTVPPRLPLPPSPLQTVAPTDMGLW